MDGIRSDMQPAISLATGDDAQFRFLAENATDRLSRHTADGIFLYASGALPGVDESAARRRWFGRPGGDERRGDEVPRLGRVDDVVELEQGRGV